jgi:hypothetical protein
MFATPPVASEPVIVRLPAAPGVWEVEIPFATAAGSWMNVVSGFDMPTL